MNEESLFAEALGRKDEARAAFLDEQCKDDVELRKRVEALLRASDCPDPFLDVPAPLASATMAVPAGERPGTVIGNYKLLEQIGEGGFGVVFMAEQTQPVRRKVAVKVLKPGMDTRQVVARFEAERQALALMDHPHIAQVFDGGETGSGRPYFVMELVRGIPITEFCDQNQLPVPGRLELFIGVCQAVQHAHQKGIIHRDLKPTNVLVTMHDDKAVVKVIDFGIAKVTGPQLTEKTLFTNFAQLIGTPMYMSPEQAHMSGLDVDTRSDIYALGVLLYELLTGTTPFDKERLRTAAYDEIRRIIREEEPPRPSTRFSTLGHAAATVSTNRKSDPKHLGDLCRGELDWIVMKALAKDRNRRYESASGFAKDVERYLADEPVHACPPSSSYQFRKFARRHKAGVAITVLSLLIIILLGGGAGWFVRDRSARHAETAARIDSALQEAARMRDQKNWSQARAAARRADVFLADSADYLDLRERLSVLARDLDMIDRLERVREDQLMLTDDFWEYGGADAAYEGAFLAYGIDVLHLEAAETAARVQASAIAEQLMLALDDWTWVSRSRPGRREPVRAAICLADPDPWRIRFRDPAVQRDRRALEELAAQPELASQPPSTVASFGRALNLAGAAPKAVEVLTNAHRRHPDHFRLNLYLGSILRWNIQPPRYQESAGYIRAALALRPMAVRVHLELGGSLFAPGHLDEAIAHFRRALELQPDYAHPYASIGHALAMKGAWQEAIDAYQKCLGGKTTPRLAVTTNCLLAEAYRATNAWDMAIACWRKAVAIDPKSVRAHTALAWTLATAPDPTLRDPKAAVAHARTAKDLSDKTPNHWSNLGVALWRAGDSKDAVETLEKADRMWKGGDQRHRFFLAMAYWQIGEKLKARQAYEEGVQWLNKNQPKNKDRLRFRAEAETMLEIKSSQ